MRIAVIIATLGRAPVIAETYRHWFEQTLPPDRVIVSTVSEKDVPPAVTSHPGIEVIYGPPGLCAQRNRGLDAIEGDCDIAVYFDDDFVPANTFLAELHALFTAHPEAVMATGRVLADGVTNGGLDYQEACHALAQEMARPEPVSRAVTPVRSAYGCNMAVRPGAGPRVRFDQRLALYGWLEDVDFSYRMAQYGSILRSDALIGVHMGTTKARSPGKRLGYSQMVNPFYCWRKGSFTPRDIFYKPPQNLMANALKSFWPEPWVDRRGRLQGNLLGLWHILCGKADPEYITRM